MRPSWRQGVQLVLQFLSIVEVLILSLLPSLIKSKSERVVAIVLYKIYVLVIYFT